VFDKIFESKIPHKPIEVAKRSIAVGGILKMETKGEIMVGISHYIQAKREITLGRSSHYYLEYLTLCDHICVSFPFKGYYTLKYKSWPKDLDEDSFKDTW
jgi:hypothetical protein